MAEREEELARASEGLRARRSPPPGAEARVLVALEASLGPLGGGGALAGVGSPGAASQTIWWAKVVGATLGLTASSLAALRAAVVLAGLDATPQPSEQAEDPTPRVEVPRREADEVPSSPPSLEAATVVGPAIDVDPARVASTPARGREPLRREDASEPLDADALAGELELMRTIRAESDALARLELLARHEREYPRGHMADERRALQAIAECELGHMTAAREGFERLREARPSSPLLDRVAAACPGL